MAYGLKYTNNFIGYPENVEYRVEIYEEGFAGADSEVLISNTNLSRGDSDMLTPIKGSEFSIEIENTTDFEFENEFGTANYGDFFVKLIKDPLGANDLMWQGYNIPNTYSEPYEQLPYFSKVNFNCGLGHLKFKKFQISKNNFYSGKKAILEVLRICLNALPNASGVGQGIRESINMFETSLYSGAPTTSDSMINSIYVDVGMYKEVEKVVEDEFGGAALEYLNGWENYKVLEEILKVFNARIYSWRGKWYIDQIREQKTSPIYYRDFLPRVGSESTLTVDGSGSYGQNQTVNRTTLNPTSEGEITIIPALEKIRYIYNVQNIDFANNNLIQNPYFNSQTGTGGSIEYWDFTGVDPSTYESVVHLSSTTNSGNYFSFDPSVVENAATYNSGIYISQTKNDVAVAGTVDSLRFNSSIFCAMYWVAPPAIFNLSTQQNDFIRNNLTVKVPIQITAGINYLQKSGGPYPWTTTASYIIFETNIFYDFAGVVPGAGGYAVGDVNLTFDTPAFPSDAIADIQLKVFQPFHNANDWTVSTMIFSQVLFNDISLIYMSNGEAIENTVILEQVIDEEAETVEMEFYHGDGVSIISQGSLRLASGLPTSEWARFGVVETKGIEEIWIEDISELRQNYIRQLDWSLYGFLEMYNTIVHTVSGVTKYYLINGFNWSPESSMFNLSLSELKTGSRNAFTPTYRTAFTRLNPLNEIGINIPEKPLNVANQRLSLSNTTNINTVSTDSTLYYKKTGYVGYYTFNENDATTVRDYSQKGQDGTGANITISDTTRTYGKDAIFNGTTSTLIFSGITDFDSISQLGIRAAINLTSNTATDTILNIPGVFKLQFDGTSLISTTTTGAGDYVNACNIAATGTWYDVYFYWSANSAVLYVTDNGLINEISTVATSGTTNVIGTVNYYLGYDGSSNHAAFKCNELAIATTTFSAKNLTSFENEQNGILLTDFGSAFEVGDIIAANWENDLISAIVTYVGTNEFKILPVDGAFQAGQITPERAGHIWDTTRQWQFIINNVPSICFYDGISLTTEIASASKKLYCLNTNGIIKTLISKSSNYTLTNTDEIILVDCTSSDVTITTPPTEDATPTGKVFEIIDIGNANPNHCIVAGGDYTINGETSSTITEPYEVRKIIFTGTEYILI